MTSEPDETVPDHTDCPRVIVEEFAERGGEVTVSTARPLVMGPYSGDGFICPTGDQIARWAPHGTAYWVEPAEVSS